MRIPRRMVEQGRKSSWGREVMRSYHQPHATNQLNYCTIPTRRPVYFATHPTLLPLLVYFTHRYNTLLVYIDIYTIFYTSTFRNEVFARTPTLFFTERIRCVRCYALGDMGWQNKFSLLIKAIIFAKTYTFYPNTSIYIVYVF